MEFFKNSCSKYKIIIIGGITKLFGFRNRFYTFFFGFTFNCCFLLRIVVVTNHEFVTFSDQCNICKKYFEENSRGSHFVYHEDASYTFCSKICMNVFILFKRKIVPCNWCKVSVTELSWKFN